MTGLVSYGSSDEEESLDDDQRLQLKSRTLSPQRSELSVSQGQRPPPSSRKEPAVPSAEDDLARPSEAHFKSPCKAMTPERDALSAPSSPYTNVRTIIRSLTLPTKPNLNIPQSPLGSPALGADQKFSHFLDLKKQGVHFNIKLASSSALKNPSLLLKLMDFAGVASEWQYTTTLSTGLWDPAEFPTWAYKEELAEAQHRLSKREEGERVRLQRESVEFVAASTPG